LALHRPVALGVQLPSGRERLATGGRLDQDDPFGVEFAELQLSPERLRAEGVAIGTRPLPYRLDYELATAGAFVTSRLRVSSRGEGWRRTLDLRRSEAGVWSLVAHEIGDVGLPSAGGDDLR
jgi:uncharacterized protein